MRCAIQVKDYFQFIVFSFKHIIPTFSDLGMYIVCDYRHNDSISIICTDFITDMQSIGACPVLWSSGRSLSI